MPSRRKFLKISLAASCLLLSARVIDGRAVSNLRASDQQNDNPFAVLRPIDAVFIAALAPAVLKGALPSDPVARKFAIAIVIAAFDRTVAGLPAASQKEVGDLLSLLTLAPTRWLTTGVSSAWDRSSEAEVAAFMLRWRDSRFALFQQGYQALVRVIVACWYGNPLAWQQIGYPGAPLQEALGA